MSTARAERGRDNDVAAGARDPRNLLVLPIAHVALQLRPLVIVVENVQQFFTRQVPHPMTGNGIAAARLLIDLLRKKYFTFPLVTDLCHYGVPQHRVRSFLTFLARDVPAFADLKSAGLTPYPVPTHDGFGPDSPIPLGLALAGFDLPPLSAASEADARDPLRPLHAVPVWDQRRLAMVAAIPPGTGGSAWENNTCSSCGSVPVGPEDVICSQCGGELLRPIVEDEHGTRLIKGFRNSSYRRMSPNEPAATITTASNRLGSDNTIHPTETRVLSVLECQLLQTIPEDFVWGEDIVARRISRIREMIGEAVPPRFTERHGQAILASLQGQFDELLPVTDSRVVKGRSKLFRRGQRNRRSRSSERYKVNRPEAPTLANFGLPPSEQRHTE